MRLTFKLVNLMVKEIKFSTLKIFFSKYMKCPHVFYPDFQFLNTFIIFVLLFYSYMSIFFIFSKPFKRLYLYTSFYLFFLNISLKMGLFLT